MPRNQRAQDQPGCLRAAEQQCWPPAGSRHSIGRRHSRNARLGGELSRTGSADAVLCGKRRIQEKLCIFSHNTDIRGGCIDGIGAGAGTGDHRDLRHNAGNPCDLCSQSGRRVQKLQTAIQLGAGGIIESNNGCAGFGGHFENADIVLDILHSHGLAVFVHNVHALPVGTAIRRTDGALRIQRRIRAVVKKCCKDFCLAGFVCCHTVTSHDKTDCFL